MNLTGLSDTDVKRLTEENKTNRRSVKKTKTVGDIIASNVFTFFNLIFAIIFGLILLTGQIKHTAFMLVVICNTLIGIVQELRAKRTIDKLSLLNSAKATVIRNKETVTVATEDVVEGDTVLLTTGEQIYADGKIIDGHIEVNESLLTGEADDVIKNVGDSVLSGSFVTSGKAYCILTAVGDNSYAAKTTAEAKKYKKVRSEITAAFDKIIKTVGFAIVPLGVLLFIRQLSVIGPYPLTAIEKTAAAIIGMIPEGLYLLTSIALAVSVINLGKKSVLIQELYAIEALARVDVICADKTGTVTSGKMTVKDVLPLSDADVSEIMRNLTAASDDDNFTAKALEEKFPPEKTYRLIEKTEFSSSRKWSSYRFAEGEFILGAPDRITEDKNLLYNIGKYTEQGLRVLLLAENSTKFPIALIILEDELRNDVEKTFSFFEKNGVDVKLISGDDPLTVSRIAKKAGVKGAEKYIDVSKLNDEETAKAAVEYTVFGRVSPEQKKIIISALKTAGHTPAMIGDGVNDVLALREAACSIAMSNGSEAARRVSNIVLMNSDFSAVPDIIFEGRRVINNIARSSSLFIVKTLYSIAITFLLIFLPFTFPYEPIQLTLVSSLTIGLPSFVLSLEPDRRKIGGSFVKNTFMKAIPSAAATVVSVITLLTVSYFTNATHAETSTAAILVMGIIGIATVFNACKPFTKLRKAMFATVIALFAAAVVLFGKSVFEFTLLPLPLLIAGTTVATLSVLAIILFNKRRIKK